MNPNILWPVTSVTITQLFGENPEDYQRFGYPGHNGLDMVGNPPILSALKGAVEKVGWEEAGYGKYIVVRSGEVSCYYAHLSSVNVAPGDLVQPGQPIAIMGSTGNSTGVHLHFGLRVGKAGAYKGFADPLPYLQGKSLLDWVDTTVNKPADTDAEPTYTGTTPTPHVKPKPVTHGKRTMYPRMKVKYF